MAEPKLESNCRAGSRDHRKKIKEIGILPELPLSKHRKCKKLCKNARQSNRQQEKSAKRDTSYQIPLVGGSTSAIIGDNQA